MTAVDRWRSPCVTADRHRRRRSVPGPVKRWVLGARPRTLPAAIVPVLVGTAAAHPSHYLGLRRGGGAGHGSPVSDFWWRALGALVVALAIQVGTNYANDYSDGIRGTDDAPGRPAPPGGVGTGVARGRQARRPVPSAWPGWSVWPWPGPPRGGSWWSARPAWPPGWFYTGGPRPYGYAGLGELFVFVFFGLVATVGTFYVETLHVDQPVVWFAAVAVGLLATALLLANNLRDIETRHPDAASARWRSGSGAAPPASLRGVCGAALRGVLVWGLVSVTGAVHALRPASPSSPLLAAAPGRGSGQDRQQ